MKRIRLHKLVRLDIKNIWTERGLPFRCYPSTRCIDEVAIVTDAGYGTKLLT